MRNGDSCGRCCTRDQAVGRGNHVLRRVVRHTANRLCWLANAACRDEDEQWKEDDGGQAGGLQHLIPQGWEQVEVERVVDEVRHLGDEECRRNRPLPCVRLELGCQALAGSVEDEGHSPPARIVPVMSPPVGARDTPKQAQCLYVVYLRRVRAKMLLK